MQAREDLLAVVSHDLRNPLGVVRMVATSMLQVSRSDERRGNWRAHAEMLQRNAVQMERLIRDLLDFSRLESGMLSVSPQACRVDDILDQAIETARVAAGSRGMQVERYAPATDAIALCDRERVLQVLGNLLGNAIQHTAEGGRIGVSAATVDGAVRISVRDSGDGIGPQQLAHLFEPYWQAAREDRRHGSGLGLGLFIAKGLVQAQGGRIWAESEPGVGSTFHFTLPLPAADRGGGPSNRSVLVIDDDAAFAREVTDILTENGYSAVALNEGAAALHYLERQQQPPALIFLDLMMPDVGGWEVLAWLRTHPVLASVPVVIMTCLGNEGIEPVVAETAGYLQKPVQAAQLLQTAARLCGARYPAQRIAQGD